MQLGFTEGQRNRLQQLGFSPTVLERSFRDVAGRQESYLAMEKEGVAHNRERLRHLLEERHKPALVELSQTLSNHLAQLGLTQVATPTIISRKAIEKMGIGPDDPLRQQIFWLDQRTCLRPMLAPGLYEVSWQLMNSQKLPLSVFEIGSCFRKESEGNNHLKEFTMLNLVEWGLPLEDREERLKFLAAEVLKCAGIKDYAFEKEESTVYGPSLDILGRDGLELASTSMGPHALDAAWKISCTWVGVGFGLERLLMYRQRSQGIHRYARSTVFLDGACLKLK